jgi:hypothetical protein
MEVTKNEKEKETKPLAVEKRNEEGGK